MEDVTNTAQIAIWAPSRASLAPWLVKRYLQHGERAKASNLADFAEEVYSAKGLRAKAEYLELVGRLKEALDVYLKITILDRIRDTNHN